MNKVAGWLFFASLFVMTFEKIHWDVAGTVNLSDLVSALFLFALLFTWVEEGDGVGKVPRSVLVVAAFGAAFLIVYLIGFWDLDTTDALNQFVKGVVKWGVHFTFLVVGLAYLVRRSQTFYWHALSAFIAGFAANAAYGVLQLIDAERGGDLDSTLLSPLTGGASSINIYGAVGGQSVYRPNALTGDPNHLGVMLVVPLLLVTPLYLRLEKDNRWRRPLAVLLGFFLIVEVATLSRSAVLGLVVGMLVLLLPYRRHFLSARFLLPLAGVVVVLLAVVSRRQNFFETVIKSRIQTNAAAASPHFDVYSFIPNVLHTHPLFGLGYNNFSVYYEFVTGKSNWGPHSFYVALFVETGIVGAAVFAAFLVWVFYRLRVARRLGRRLAELHDPLARRVRPLAWGFTAALAGTLAANAFYLTIPFYYFYALAMLALAVPVVFARRL
ncbi:MAG TPA: O-antigen ligase family protein [Gaiellaceae bacterium]|nr:O-antigen ligase family protein [Gaiellaceae bacterium]